MSDIITIPLSKKGKHAGKYEAIVSIEDADLAVFNWMVRIRHQNLQYAQRRDKTVNGSQPVIILHRVIMERVLGRPLASNELVDHRDMNGLNCSRENLRLATNQQNQANRPAQKNNKSGYKGVFWYKRANKWRAVIKLDGKQIHLGLFSNPEDAYKAYLEKAKELFGEYARGE